MASKANTVLCLFQVGCIHVWTSWRFRTFSEAARAALVHDQRLTVEWLSAQHRGVDRHGLFDHLVSSPHRRCPLVALLTRKLGANELRKRDLLNAKGRLRLTDESRLTEACFKDLHGKVAGIVSDVGERFLHNGYRLLWEAGPQGVLQQLTRESLNSQALRESLTRQGMRVDMPGSMKRVLDQTRHAAGKKPPAVETELKRVLTDSQLATHDAYVAAGVAEQEAKREVSHEGGLAPRLRWASRGAPPSWRRR